MSKRLERAISKLRKLPKGLQDTAAERLLEYINQDPTSGRVSIDEAREAYADGDFLTLSKWKHDLGLGDN
jgi:hypothetical protein